MEITFSKIKVDNISPSLKEGLMQAQIRQTVSRNLPSTRVSNSLKDSIYSNEDLGIVDNIFKEERVAWMEVAKTATVASVQADLDKFPNAKLRRFLASTPILSDDQTSVYKNGLSGEALDSFNTKYGIKAGTAWGDEHVKLFISNIVDRQVVRYGENNSEGKPADEVVLFAGKQQFRRIELSASGADDVDMRVSAVEVKDIKDIALAPTKNAVEVAA